jgi:hypothetical protein
MKYVLMFTSRPDLRGGISEQREHEVYRAIYQWFQDNADTIVDGGAELHPVETATTVKSDEGGELRVVDGPYSEVKEIIGGFSVIDVPDMDAAVALTRTWPALEFPGTAIEIRPMVVDYSQFE